MASLIEPTTFDLIVLGTGLPQCIVAAAAASNGHSVLHLDPCDFYGSHWASLSLTDFRDWCRAAGQLPFPSSPQVSASNPTSGPRRDELDDRRNLSSFAPVYQAGNSTAIPNERRESINGYLQETTFGQAITQNGGVSDDFSDASRVEEDGTPAHANDTSIALDNLVVEEPGIERIIVERSTSLYSSFECSPASVDNLGPSRSFCIDLTGPKLAYCAEPLVDLLIRCGASNYLEFKSVEANFMWSDTGLLPVPSSRADVFQDRTLTNAEKRHLMRFFKLVSDHTSSDAEMSQISQEELESPFIDFLHGRQVPLSVQAMILYAIALSDHEQHSGDENIQGHLMSTREGVESLALYLKSVGRFPNSTGAFLYPLYGQGELSQAFSRSAAVKGALYALKMAVRSLLKDQETGNLKGLQMATEQMIFSERLVVGPTMCSTLCKFFPSESTAENEALDTIEQQDGNVKVARGVCISDKSLKPDMSTIMVVFPPHSITEREDGVIRVVQLGSSVSVCPEGKFLVQLSMVCSNDVIGIETLQKATQLLFQSWNSGGVAEDHRPTLLWAAFYVHDVIFSQGVKWFSPGQIAAFCMPDEALHFQTAVVSAENVYKGLYPEDLFFPRQSSSATDDSGVDGDVANGHYEEASEML